MLLIVAVDTGGKTVIPDQGIGQLEVTYQLVQIINCWTSLVVASVVLRAFSTLR